MPWDTPETWDREALEYHRKLIALRHAHPALRRGTYRRLYAQGEVYVFERQLGDETLLVAVNAGEGAQGVTLAAAPAGALVYGKGEATMQRDGVRLSIEARSGAIWLQGSEK
jgi:glycosidase